MGGFFSGLGFLIRILALLFTWAAVAIFISPELALVMGLLVIVLWAIVFLPKGLWDELSWQRNASATLKAVMTAAPDYQPGTALPAPTGGSSSGGGTALASYDTPSGASATGAVDHYREMPKLEFAPRDHIGRFKRSLALPVVGILMVLCANNDDIIRKMMATVGLEHELPIEWGKLTLPDAWIGKHDEMQAAARLAMAREPYCGRILEGQIEATKPLTSTAEAIKTEIEAGRYRYVFNCAHANTANSPTHKIAIWVTPEDLERSRMTALLKLMTAPPSEDVASAACKSETRKTFAALGASLDEMPIEAPSYYKGSLPFPDYARIVSIETLHREGRVFGQLEVNCYLGANGRIEARFTRPQIIPPLVTP